MLDVNPTRVLLYAVAITAALFLLMWLVVWVERRVRQYLQSLWRRDRVDREAVRRTWEGIERMAESENEYELRQALVKADSLLDDVLKQKELPGRVMAERMKFAIHRYPELRVIWKSHRLRNELVHEHAAVFRPRDVHAALKDYKRALKLLGAL